MRNIGYARVSTEDQHLDLQLTALKEAKCELLYADHGVSGKNASRPGLDKALARLKPGDTLVVWRLDRLGRSLGHLVKLIEKLSVKRVHFRSLTEAIDTTTPGGMLVFHLMASMAQFERTLISERTKAGIAAARARGVQHGRSPALTAQQQDTAIRLLENHSFEEVGSIFNVSDQTIRRLAKKIPGARENTDRSA
ncbi:recombinase family protein [Paraburkholderia sp. ZP32-5]|uniref:recombinase family protein n=1 Tax=Paraburkholderia sp. ZP32-5 TaxID=2883245 RepID=UPI001F167FEF|nr:recombinase family protein [Paraburkholderia sp. ZP32-5]